MMTAGFLSLAEISVLPQMGSRIHFVSESVLSPDMTAKEIRRHPFIMFHFEVASARKAWRGVMNQISKRPIYPGYLRPGCEGTRARAPCMGLPGPARNVIVGANTPRAQSPGRNRPGSASKLAA